jgi:hypothetical protein
MSTAIQIASKSGITIGTTAVTSGTDTRVFFQQAGVVQQDANFTFNNTQKRLTLRAVGTAVTDIPFLVRNSADTDNLAYVSGNGLAIIGINASSSPTLIIDPSGSARATLRGGTNQSILLNSSGFNNLNGGSGGWDIEATGGQIRQRNGSNYTLLSGNFFGIGRTPSARLDVQSQGALSTDIAFRVRNSADTSNIFEVRGNGDSVFNTPVFVGFGAGATSQGHQLNMRFGLSTSTPFAYFDNASFNLDVDRFCNVKLGFGLLAADSHHSIALGLGTVPSSRNYQQTVAFWTAISQGTNDSGFAQSGADTAGNNAIYTNYYGKNIVLGGTTQGNGKNVFVMLNGTAPSTNIANGGQLYVEGGALKFRGSSGTISTVAPA